MPLRQKHPSRRNSNHASLYNDLIETQTYLEQLQSEQSRVAENFKVWSKHRKSTIDTVRNLQKRIDNAFVGSNVAKGAGALTGIVGVTALVIGAVLELKGQKSAAQFFRTGQFCTGASEYSAIFRAETPFSPVWVKWVWVN